MAKHSVNDHQREVLFFASDDLADDELAVTLGLKVTTVHATRWQLRKQGWSCRVSYGICSVCDEPFLRRGFRTGGQKFHPSCRHAAYKVRDQRLNQARSERMNAEDHQDRLDRFHAWDRDWQDQTRRRAANSGTRWSEEEDAMIMDPAAPPDYELALSLGRSLKAVCWRRNYIRSRHADALPSDPA